MQPTFRFFTRTSPVLVMTPVLFTGAPSKTHGPAANGTRALAERN